MNTSIQINRRFLRSVNIANDCRLPQGLSGYVVTPSVRKALARIQEAFVACETDRAFTLTAPYGTGKSAFGLFLLHLLSSQTDGAWQLLEKADAPLAASFKKAVWDKKTHTTKGYVVLPVTARRASVSCLLAEAFDSVEALPRSIVNKVDDLRKSRDSKTSIRIVKECATEFVRAGFRGVFFVFDEFGKVFEQAHYAGKETDVFVLQELAEAASRSAKDAPIFFLGMLHQSFADYASIDTPLRKEFAKIEGRFEPISFTETPAAQIQLMSTAFPSGETNAQTHEFQTSVKKAVENKLPSFVGLTDETFTECAKRVYPLHPMTMVALPLFFRRFGQNERSIFSFLTSNEPGGLQDFVAKHDEGTLLRLCDVYDYFFENYEVQLGRHPYGQAFLEANAVIHSKASLEPTDIEIIKTVAVLTSLGMQSPVKATEEFIKLSMMPETFTSSLTMLLSQSILVYRKFNKTYALWSGSDIDLLERYEEADKELSKVGFSMSETLRKFLTPVPIIAKRHSLQTGSLRYFETLYVNTPQELADVQKQRRNPSASGAIVICLPASSSEVETFIEEAAKLSKNIPDVLFAIPSDISELSEALKEVRRINWIEENTPDLRDDRIALREVSIRRAEANQCVAQHQYGLLDPRPAAKNGGGCQYVYSGQVCHDIKTNRNFSVRLSSICDALYTQSPTVRNELINKRNPSAQAASARNSLIKRLNNPEILAKPLLGIEGYPPERSIYESLFLASGMHREKNGVYEFVVPSKSAKTKLLPAWHRMDELIFANPDKPLVLKDLYAELAKPPYGVLDGLMPLLLTAFYVQHRDEVSLYSENTFIPEPQDAQFELMVRRPELFAISGAHITGTRQQIVERLAQGLHTEPKVLAVVRRLYAMMNTLSKYAKETNDVSKVAQDFRRVFFDAKSPEKLLFVDLPKVFGLEGIDGRRQDANAFNQYFKGLNACTTELGNALPRLISKHRGILLEACGFENTPAGWQSLYDRASFLLARIGGSEIGPFLQNVVNTAGDWDKADQVMAYIEQAPMANWGTSQIAEFKKNVVGTADLFHAAYRKFERVPAALDSRERKSADDLTRTLTSQLNAKKLKPAILRAALLACLEKLDKGGKL